MAEKDPQEYQKTASSEMVPREKLIQTAVAFLQNSRVMQSEDNFKRNFLRKKGLSNEEINIAFQRNSLKHPESVVNVPMIPQRVTFWPWLHGISSTSVIISMAAYFLYKFYKKFIAPYFFGANKKEERISKLENTLTSLQDYIVKLETSIATMNDKFIELYEKMNKVISTDFTNSSSSIETIKKDIGSLKGLLLNRKQFPPAPSLPPLIPTWQREHERSDAENTSEESDKLVIKVDNLDKSNDGSESCNSSGKLTGESNSSDNGSFICVGDSSEGN